MNEWMNEWKKECLRAISTSAFILQLKGGGSHMQN